MSLLLKFGDLFFLFIESVAEVFDLLILIIDLISEFEQVLVVLGDLALELFVLLLGLVKLLLEFTNELSLVLYFDNRSVDFGLEHHLLLLVIKALSVNFNENLALGDNVVVANNFLVHFNSHFFKLILGILNSSLELTLFHVRCGHGFELLLEVLNFLHDSVVESLSCCFFTFFDLFVDPRVIVDLTSALNVLESPFVVINPVLFDFVSLELKGLSSTLDGIDIFN